MPTPAVIAKRPQGNEAIQGLWHRLRLDYFAPDQVGDAQ